MIDDISKALRATADKLRVNMDAAEVKFIARLVSLSLATLPHHLYR
jgi:hypothetical protein